MQVILKQDVDKLGKTGELVKVTPGYARNYLIPKQLAVAATAGNLKMIQVLQQSHAKRDMKEKASAEVVAREVSRLTLELTRKAGEGGSLFGSVTSIDIAEKLAAHKIEVDKRKILLDEPIKSIGEYTIPVRLHREVTAHIRINIQAEAE
jgi:large subunit ribosomal protein L9